jgi:hypothetical protein
MQYNFLGGQSQRDTLTQALGQRNPVLEAQLDFSKSAFVTGVQGAGQTMRTAMNIGEQQRDSIMKDKTAKAEGAMNRQNSAELLSQKLAADSLEFDRQTETRRTEVTAAEGRAKLEQQAKEARDKAEFDRRRQLGLDDRKVVEDKTRTTTTATNQGTLAGYKAKFDALFPTIKDKAVAERFKGMFDKLYGIVSAEKDPDKFAGMLKSLEGLLDPKELNAFVRSTQGGADEKKEEAPSVVEDPNKSDVSKATNDAFNAVGKPVEAAKPADVPAINDFARSLDAAATPTAYSSMPDPSAGGYPFEQRNLLGQKFSERYDLNDSMATVLSRPIPTTPIPLAGDRRFGSGFSQ